MAPTNKATFIHVEMRHYLVPVGLAVPASARPGLRYDASRTDRAGAGAISIRFTAMPVDFDTRRGRLDRESAAGGLAQALAAWVDPLFQALARTTLVSFVLTFIAARVTVFLIVARRIPDIYLHLGGTHVHHLNYGIFLLSGVGAYLLLMRPGRRGLGAAAVIYGIGLGLTFDEFGLWLHLGGSYWQRASFDAIVVIGALLTLLTVAPQLGRFRPRHWVTAAALAAATVVFAVMLRDSFRYADRLLIRVQVIEASQPPLR